MKKLQYPLVTLVLFSMLYLGYTTQGDPVSDFAPSTLELGNGNNISPDTTPPGNWPYPTDFNWNFSAIPGVNGGSVGAFWFDGKYYLNRWNNNVLYRYNDNGPGGGPGTLADSNTNYAGQIRDITTDGNFLYGGRATNVLYRMDAAGNLVNTKAVAGASFRAIAWDPNRGGFWNCNFAGNIICHDTNGVVLGTIVTAIGGKYGVAFDSTTSADSAFLWVWSQSSTTTADLTKFYLGNGQVVATYVFTLPGVSIGIAGCANTVQKGNKFMMLLNWQNYAVTGYTLKESGPPPVGGNTLILIHDSTVVGSQAKRRADQDSLMKYIPGIVGNYTLQTFTATTDLTGLDSYDAIILAETSFDDISVRNLSANSRTAIKNWLNSGTPANKKAFLTIGGDQGYNYARTGSPALDLELSEGLLKFGYRADNSNIAAAPGITGTSIDVGNDRVMTTTPAGGGFWPDGGILQAGGTDLYKYRNRVSLTDSLAGIGYNGAGYVSVTLLQDPRYFTGSLGAVLAAGIKYLTDNGGLITSIGNNNVSEITADQFILSQNYPNPFNPVTKINFTLPKNEFVSLRVYDITGRQVATLVNELRGIGIHTIEFDASSLASGAYFYSIQAGDFREVKKMMLLK